mmetsp:Transcript_60601/g.100628  ORF Transcript_60601/g.100628 Transcript_60601/m.100628 type:complete len:348 (+) Transcript_60601:116-1159(+)|eukprot:CAMPEP_0119316108 /NCGR_PEP_ID=MMETSP1333-20130426/38635_1 /TAXON_ID=418940 /ORGANISM="Scyphosphaera apsteinii, Strain RCC1455" /LENGTH=347 /DNA_ID=CAMNT_0007321677 /DNA_START=92 /DNA_END=1135 /DNA_ORIENTATION=+
MQRTAYGRRVFITTLLARFFRSTYSHAILTSVTSGGVRATPRNAAGMKNTGAKLTPFASARSISSAGCGGTANGDPGVEVPTVAFSPQDLLDVAWELTIPHPADNLNDGVRVAVHYGPGDSFEENVLVGGVAGSGEPGTVSAAAGTVRVTLPNKLSNFATIQWIWSASQDGGSYIGCTDVAITSNGELPNFNNLPSQAGNVLSGVKASATGPGSIISAPQDSGGATPVLPLPADDTTQDEGSKGGSSVLIAGLVVAALVVLAAGGCYYYYYHTRPKSKPMATQVTGGWAAGANVQACTSAIPPPPPPPPGVLALPPGWSTATDPASGRVYYLNAATGQSSWTNPAAP